MKTPLREIDKAFADALIAWGRHLDQEVMTFDNFLDQVWDKPRQIDIIQNTPMGERISSYDLGDMVIL